MSRSEKPPKIVEVEEEDEDEDEDDEDMPGMEEIKADGASGPAGKTPSRSEKKARKAISKLGMKPVEGIMRVTIRKSKTMVFVIKSPEVYQSPASDTYVVFGDATVEDTSAQAQSKAAEKFVSPVGATATAAEEEDDEEMPALTSADATGDDDGAGLDEGDISVVMSNGKVTRATAVKALRNAGGDLVKAVMALSS